MSEPFWAPDRRWTVDKPTHSMNMQALMDWSRQHVEDHTVHRYEGSATWDPGSVADGAFASTTVSVPGAVVGRPATAGFTQMVAGVFFTAVVTSADTVTVHLHNESGSTQDLASGTVTAVVL